MTRSDVLRVMAVLKEAYPSYYNRKSREELESAIGLWMDMFSDIDAEAALIACKRIIGEREDTYPPSIGMIRQEALKAGKRHVGDWLSDAEYNRQVISYLDAHGMLSEGRTAPLLEGVR